MPKRPIAHQLEDISRAKFKLALPPAWVFRDTTPDYGIDGEVEVFDSDGNSTGLTFLVQLKATQDEQQPKRRRVSLTKDQILYYRKRQPPVLIVRYDDVEDLLLCRWAGRIDLYGSKPDAQSFSFVMNDSEVWKSETPSVLVDDLAKINRTLQGKSSPPIAIKLTVSSEVSSQFPVTAIRSYIGAQIKGVSGTFIKIINDDNESFDAEIVISSSEITMHIGPQSTCTFHDFEITSDTLPQEFPQVVLATIAISFAYLGQHSMASRLILDVFKFSVDELPDQVVILLMQPLFLSGHFEEATRIAGNCFKEHEAFPMELTFRMLAMRYSRELTPDKKASPTRWLHTRLENEQESGEQSKIGIAHYNLANHLRSNSQFSDAVRHYKCAAKHAPSYLKKSYFLSELAGVLFLGGRFQMATVFYERAIEALGDDDPEELVHLKALHADALMFSGHFEEALELNEKIALKSGKHSDLCSLKSFILSHIVLERGVKQQKRNPRKAIEELTYKESSELDTKLQCFEEAFKHDVLCPLAWFNYGVTYSQQGFDPDHDRWIDALAGFLAAALAQPNDIEAWVNSILCALNHNKLWGQIPPISLCAYFAMGEEFLASINSEILKRMSGEHASEFLEVIQKAAYLAHSYKTDTTTFRFLDPDGNVAYKNML